MLVIRRFRAEEWPKYRTLRLAALADAPEAFGSTLARESAFPDTLWQERLLSAVHAAAQFPLVAEVAGQPAGLAWGRIEAEHPDVATLYQMWVAPARRHAGIGAAILRAMIEWASAEGVGEFALSVTAGNSAARSLYIQAGFRDSGPLELLHPASTVLAQPMRLSLRRVV